MDSICYCCNITFMQALLYSCGCGGHERGVWLRFFFAAQCMIMEKMMPLLMWMGSRRHELTPPFLLRSVPTIFSCSLFRNISLKADMPRGMGRTHQFERSTPWKNAMDFPTNDNLLLVFSAGRAFFGLSIFRGHHALIFWFSKYMLIKTVTEKAQSSDSQGWPRKRAWTRNGKIICHNCCPFFPRGGDFLKVHRP